MISRPRAKHLEAVVGVAEVDEVRAGVGAGDGHAVVRNRAADRRLVAVQLVTGNQPVKDKIHKVDPNFAS
jgi:hypothetical protein